MDNGTTGAPPLLSYWESGGSPGLSSVLPNALIDSIVALQYNPFEGVITYGTIAPSNTELDNYSEY